VVDLLIVDLDKQFVVVVVVVVPTKMHLDMIQTKEDKKHETK